MALSLVADYESSSNSGDEYEAVDKSKGPPIQLASALDMLSDNSSIKSSVFSNPYQEAENYEQSILEKHVKMTAIKKSESSEPKKICFKFNKGKCRMGNNCRFLHHNPHANIEEVNNSDSEDQAAIENNSKKVKKRCGLKDDLYPPKKFMKSYKK